MKKFGCSDKIVNLIKALHAGMQAKVAQGRDISKEFAVTNGVKQGCFLAPTLFSLYLAAMLQVAFKDYYEGTYMFTWEALFLALLDQTRSSKSEKARLLQPLVNSSKDYGVIGMCPSG